MELDELVEISKKCMKCGFCKQGCPMFSNYREEKWSARGIWILLENIKNGKTSSFLNSWLFREIIYACTLCGNCVTRCPARLDTPKAVLTLRKLFLS